MESQSSRTSDPFYGLKGEAQALQDQAKAAGGALKRADALQSVATQNGFKDWNAVAAAAKAGKLRVRPDAAPTWTNIDEPLPRLPLRMTLVGDREQAAVAELMRWARQLDYIGNRASEEDDSVGDLMAHIGGEVPYVFVRDPGRFDDDHYHLCDRGYDEIDGVVFTREQLEESGVVAWQNLRGSHDGYSMFSVVDDDLRMHSSRVELKQAARVVARIAVIADSFSKSPRVSS